jgi:23S rRNA pseudouridine1911/1915/1917 synthase
LRELRKEKRKVTLTPQIIFEDDSFLVIDKPASLTVNHSDTTKNEETIQSWIEKNFQFPLAQDNFLRNGLVHRLDKETSGLLLIAKTKEAFENLQSQFKERKVKKKYLALVHGLMESSQGVIEASVSRSPFDRKKFGVFLGGREAKTNYQVLEKLKEFSLLELSPETGRTHQIRVHLKFLGHPIVGDEKYAGRKTARGDRQWCPRQFLHAEYLSFDHPLTKQRVEFSSKLPSDLQLVMMKLRT